MRLQVGLISSFAVLSAALPNSNQPRCVEFDHPIHVSVPLTQFHVPEFTDSYQSTAFLTNSVFRTANLSALVGPQKQLDRVFNIHFQYCEPKDQGRKAETIQILSHGVGFDKSYWDFSKDYSYVGPATAAGYATLSYDRLGVGRSTHADPYFEIQTPTQVAILAEISRLVRSGQLCQSVPVPKKLVHVGHSFGSLLTNGLVASYPTLSDGIVLTGFSHNSSYMQLFELCLGFELASSNNPRRFKGYNSGYLTWGNEFDNQCAFYTYPFFDTAVLRTAEATKPPFAIAELLSFTSIPLLAGNFTGPVLMLSGEFDLPFCGGECQGILEGPGSLSPFVFANAKPFATYVHPKAGHGINLHYNATGAYSVINNFFRSHGL